MPLEPRPRALATRRGAGYFSAMSRIQLIAFTLLAGGVLLGTGCARKTPTEIPRHRPARTSWGKAHKPSPQAQSHARYADGVIAEMQGELDTAMDAFTTAVALDPTDEELLLDVTLRFLQYKHPERALPLLTNAVSRSRSFSGLVDARLGVVYTQLGQPERAIAANQAAIRKQPTLLSAHQNLYLNHLQQKQEDQALHDLEAAATVAGADADFLAGIAELFANYGMLVPAQRVHGQSRARELLLLAADLSPTNTTTQLKLAEGFNLVGDTTRTIEFYQRALAALHENLPLRDAVRTKLADLYLRTRDRARATEMLEAILRDDPTNAQANFVLGNLAFDDKRMERAAEYFARALLLNPRLEPAHYDLALTLLNLERYDDALATLAQARERFASSFLMEYLSGIVHIRRKDYTNAVRYFTAAEIVAQAGETNRLTAPFYFQTAAALERIGRLDEAAATFEKCLQLAPDFHEAQNYLGYMWAEQGTNLHRARELIEQAVQAEPENAAYLDSLGWALFKLGQLPEALEAMHRAIQFADPPDPTLFDHLGDIHQALGEKEAARAAWQKSLEIEPNDAIRRKLGAPAP